MTAKGHQVVSLLFLLVIAACGEGISSTQDTMLAPPPLSEALTTTTTTLVDPTTTSSSSVASGGDQPDFSEPTAFRAADLEVGELVRLAVEDIEDPDAFFSANPTADVIRQRRADEPPPTEAELLEAIPLLEAALVDVGFDGVVTMFPQAGPSFGGTVPAFSAWLDDDFYRVDIDAFPTAPGLLRFLAERELFSYSLVEEDLPADTVIGSVWLGATVVYGHNGSENPDDWVPGQDIGEWAAFDLGDQLYLVRVNQRDGRTKQILGADVFLAAAAETIEAAQAAGLTRFPTSSHAAFLDSPEVAEMLTIAFTTSCKGAICGPIRIRTGG